MNKERRTAIRKAIGFLEEAKALVETSCSEEENAYDSLTEGLQQTERGIAMSKAVGFLTDAATELETMISDLEGIVQ